MGRRFQFSLGDLLVSTLVLAAVFWAVGFIHRLRQDRPIPVPVTGTVTLNGEPAKGWQVIFRYSGVDLALATTDADGKFTLARPSTGEATVWPGEYRVGLIPPAPPPEKYEWRPSFAWVARDFPREYSDPDRSGLNAIVKQSAKNDCRFDLTYEPESAPWVFGPPPVPLEAVLNSDRDDALPSVQGEEDDASGTHFEQFSLVRVRQLLHDVNAYDRWRVNQRPPRVGDVGTLIDGDSRRDRYVVESSDDNEVTIWLAVFAADELEPLDR